MPTKAQLNRIQHVTGARGEEVRRAFANPGDDVLVALGAILSQRDAVEVPDRDAWDLERGQMFASRWRLNHPDLAAAFPPGELVEQEEPEEEPPPAAEEGTG